MKKAEKEGSSFGEDIVSKLNFSRKITQLEEALKSSGKKMFSLKEREIKTGIMLLMAGGIIYFLFSLGTVLIPFLAGIILAYLLYPLLDFLRKRNISKAVPFILYPSFSWLQL